MPEFICGLLFGLIIGYLLSKKQSNVQEQSPKKDPADWWKESQEE